MGKRLKMKLKTVLTKVSLVALAGAIFACSSKQAKTVETIQSEWYPAWMYYTNLPKDHKGTIVHEHHIETVLKVEFI